MLSLFNAHAMILFVHIYRNMNKLCLKLKQELYSLWFNWLCCALIIADVISAVGWLSIINQTQSQPTVYFTLAWVQFCPSVLNLLYLVDDGDELSVTDCRHHSGCLPFGVTDGGPGDGPGTVWCGGCHAKCRHRQNHTETRSGCHDGPQCHFTPCLRDTWKAG